MLSLLRVADGSRLFANAFYLWLSFIAPSASGFFFWVVAARLYSAEAVGVGAAAFSAIVILSEVAHLGMGFGLVRWLPALNNKDAARLINSAFTLGGIVSLGVFLIFLFGVELLAPPLRILRQQPAYFLFFLALAPWAVLYPLLGHTFLAFRDARYTLLQNLVATMVRIGLVVALASYLPSFGVIAAAGAGVVVGVGLGFAYSLRRLLPGYRPRLALPDGSLRQLLPYSFGNYLSNLLLWAPTYVMPILAVNRLGAAQGSYFYAAWIMGVVMLAISISLGWSLFAEGSHDVRRLYTYAGRALAAALTMGGLAVMASYLLGGHVLLVFGREYADNGRNLLTIVAVASLPAAVANTYMNVVRVTKELWRLLAVSGVLAVVSLGAGWVLLGRVGLEGGGWSLVAGYGAAALASGVLAVRRPAFEKPPVASPAVTVERGQAG